MTDALLAALVARANARGLILATEASLLQELRVGSTALRNGLARLEAKSVIEVLAPPPFLVAKLRGAWSGKQPRHPQTPAKIAVLAPRAYSFQSSLSQSKLLNESYRHSAGDGALLQEILRTLGESDPTTFRGALRRYPPSVIRTVLERVRRMPTIRKSRTALFRYLLPRIARERPSIH